VNCSRWERQLALLVEGDLGGREAREVEEHLAVCPACRDFVEELRQSQVALRDLGGEEVDGAALAAVRQRVLAQVESREPAWFFGLRWWHAVPVGVAAAVMAVVLWPRVPEVEPPPALAIWAPPAPEVVRPAPPPSAMKRVPEIESVAPAEPLLVEFVTNDPDVVIYWVIDQDGGKS
jgi:hypothetical protein